MLRKIACNATNSAAIGKLHESHSPQLDDQGQVHVWGAGKLGLLGNPKQKVQLVKPMPLQLKAIDENEFEK